MGFISFMKGLIRQLFSPDELKTVLGVKPVMTLESTEKLKLWSDMYAGNAPWLSDAVKSLRSEQGIVREFSNISVGEMTASVSDANLDAALKAALRNFNVSFQSGLATGALVIKPMPDLTVQFLPQTAFVPLSYDIRGRLINVVFPEVVQDGERWLTRLEWHRLDESGLTITNRAFVSYSKNRLGTETDLSVIDKWAALSPETRYPGMTRPIFGYYRNPIDSPDNTGISIFDPAVDLIKIADTQFGRLEWEFESGERVIHADPAAFKSDEKDGKGKFTLPKLNKRLYRAIDIEADKGKSFFSEFSPEFREQSIIAGLEEFKRSIEFAVGLSYGDISNPQTVEKTATEILAAKKRKYNTVNAIQQNLRDCLDDLVYALAFWSAKTMSGYEFVCDFKDSILTDEETERQQDRQDVSMGVMRLEEYRAKWYGESVDEAAKNLPEPTEVVL